MTVLTHEKMSEILEAHAGYEYANDLDGTMAPVGPDPVWEIYPLGRRIIGRDAVRESYRLQFLHLFPHLRGGTERTRAYGDDFIISEQVAHLEIDGQSSESYMAAVLAFDDDSVISERVYASGPLADVLAHTFTGAFREFPGVIDLMAGSLPS